jgi:hypothetical protein
MASALFIDPEIVHGDLVAVCIRGMGYYVDWSYPEVEYNLRNDIAAGKEVFESGMTIWQVPATVCSNVRGWLPRAGGAHRGTSQLANYLIRQLREWNARYSAKPIDFRSLCDA